MYPNPLTCDFEGLKGRILSNKKALELQEPKFALMVSALEHIFQTHQRAGTVTIEHDTRVVHGQLSGKR